MNKKVLIGIIAAVVVLAIAAAFAIPALFGGKPNLSEAYRNSVFPNSVRAKTNIEFDWAPVSEQFNVPGLQTIVEKVVFGIEAAYQDMRTKGGDKQVEYVLSIGYDGSKLFDVFGKVSTKKFSVGSTTPYTFDLQDSFENAFNFKLDVGKYLDVLFDLDSETKTVLQSEAVKDFLNTLLSGATEVGSEAMPSGGNAHLFVLPVDPTVSREAAVKLVNYYFEKDDLRKAVEAKAKKLLQLLLDSGDYKIFVSSDDEANRIKQSLENEIANVGSTQWNNELDRVFTELRDGLKSMDTMTYAPALIEIPDEFKELLEQKLELKLWVKGQRIAYVQFVVKTPIGPMTVSTQIDYSPSKMEIKAGENTFALDAIPQDTLLMGFTQGLTENAAAQALLKDIGVVIGQDIDINTLMYLLLMGAGGMF